MKNLEALVGSDSQALAVVSDRGLASGMHFEFRKCIKIIVKKVCASGSGDIEVHQANGKYVLAIAGEFNVDGLGGAHYRREIPLVKSCVSIPVVSHLSVEVCIDKVELPRKADVVVNAIADIPVYGQLKVEIFRKTIVFAKLSDVRALLPEIAPLMIAGANQDDTVVLPVDDMEPAAMTDGCGCSGAADHELPMRWRIRGQYNPIGHGIEGIIEPIR